MDERTLAIDVEGLKKSFRVPDQAPPGFTERVLHPTRFRRPNRLEVLKGISFQVQRGEYFAIVGRNGSGKSTLLRLMSGIYRPDAGRIRAHGRVAPFIELGVGFDPQLSARNNIMLNGVMLGMTPDEIRGRVDSVLEFAELRDFSDMKLKNFSSGMRVRLGFAVMVEADPEVLLIDEILAVGDAAFRDRCAEVFLDLTSRGKTVVLVTHQVAGVERDCDRAMLLDRGHIARIGDPSEVVQGYFDLNLEQDAWQSGAGPADDEDLPPARQRSGVADLWLAGRGKARVATVEENDPLDVRVVIEAHKPIDAVGVRLELRRQGGARIFVSPDPDGDAEIASLAAEETARVRIRLENPLLPGRYVLRCTVLRNSPRGIVPASPTRALGFEVGGAERRGAGLLSLEHEVSVERAETAEPAGT